jgi:hypothetical protein
VLAKLPRLEWIVMGIALVVLILDAGGGPAWGAASTYPVIAARMDHLASAPLYDLLAGVLALAPVGEVAFRVALFNALLAALTLAGVVAAVRALVPRDVGAALVSVLLLLVAAPFREAAAFATPAMLAACGAVWALACAARFARDAAARDAAAALAACAIVVGSAPWLGAVVTLAIAAWLYTRGARGVVVAAIAIFGGVVASWWFGATGTLPAAASSLALAIAATAPGGGAIVVGAGLLGSAFAAITGLAGTRFLALLLVIVAAHEIIFGGSAVVLLALLAIGAATIPSAIIRATQPQLEGTRRQLLACGAGIPLVAIALVVGGRVTVEDPGTSATDLASDLTSTQPPGPGVFVATRATTWLAVQYEAAVAGARPDLSIAPPLPAQQADAIVANALRSDRIAAADAAAFGRLDVRRVIPRGRGFQLVGDLPAHATPTRSPARYATRSGREQAVMLAVERARHEAASNRLDAAARALGLAERFGAADLAILAVTLATADRPALFGFLPQDDRPGDWMIDVFGDDLAWVAGIAVPPVDDRAPMPRRLHAIWRDIILGKKKPDDPAIAALGPRAVTATRELFAPPQK